MTFSPDLQPLFSLKDRVILVTGGGGHLGRAMVQALAGAGAKVAVMGRNPDRLEQVRSLLGERAEQLHIQPGDVTKDADRTAWIAQISRHWGRIDGLVNNAYGGPAQQGAEDAYAYAYRLTVTAAAELVEAARPWLKRSPGASVVNIASMYGMVSPDPAVYRAAPQYHNPPHYGPAKAALLQWTRYMARHLAADAISPGPFPDPTVQEASPSFIGELERKTPLGRIGQPAELAGALVFLLSGASSYVTGHNLVVDGGWTSW